MKILVKAYAGSHLFGTSTPDSDTDFKGVYLPSAEQILLGNAPETIQHSTGKSDSKNSSEDEDVELYSLAKFYKMLRKGDTAAIELLFTPDHLIVEKSIIWDSIVLDRDRLISKNIKGVIGYSRQQANKYGRVGKRLGELEGVIKDLKLIESTLEFQNPKLKHVWEDLLKAMRCYSNVKLITLNTAEGVETPAIDILGKKFDYHCTFAFVIQVLKKLQKGYGQRARESKNNNGTDWKALSHALRVSYQGIELLETGKITLPLVGESLEMVRGTKLGKFEVEVVSDQIAVNLERLEELSEESQLRENVDEDYIKNSIVNLHKAVVNLG